MFFYHRTGFRSYRWKGHILMNSSVSLKELCIHQVCVCKKSNFAESIDCFARNGVTSTALWKPLVDEVGVKNARKFLKDSGVSAISMCPLVLLEPQNENDSFLRAKHHLQFLEEAAELEVNSVIVITGGLSPENRDLNGQRHVLSFQVFLKQTTYLTSSNVMTSWALQLILIPFGGMLN